VGRWSDITKLGLTLLCIICDEQLMKNGIDFVKIKFHLNENIE
jgi:hypothetical protein